MPKQSSRDNKFSIYTLRSLDFLQVLFFVQATQVGIGLFSLPRVVSERAHHDGWMAVIFSGVYVQIALVIMIVLLRRFRDLDLYAIMREVLGKWIGHGLGFLFALYCVLLAGVCARGYVEIVLAWLFPTTSSTAFNLLLLFPIIYCATGGARVLGRFAIIAMMATFWVLILNVVPARQIHFDYYRPFFDATVSELASATWSASLSVTGFELLLVVYPFIQNKKKAFLASSIGTWFTILIYLSVTLVAIGFYSEEQLKQILSPTLFMHKIVELPMIERVEQIVVSAWSFLIVNTSANYMWSAGRYLYSFGKWSEPTCVYICSPIIIVTAVWPLDKYRLDDLNLKVGEFGAVISLILPLMLLFLAILFKKKGKSQQAEESDEGTQAS